MRRLVVALAVLVTLLPVSATAVPPGAGDRAAGTAGGDRVTGASGDDHLDLYEVTTDIGTEAELRAEGYDVVSTEQAGGEGRVTLELVLTDAQVGALRQDKGLRVGLVRNAQGQSTARAATLEADSGFEVWRSYSEPGGIRDEMENLAERYDRLTELQTIGRSLRGQPIYAMRVTRDADRVRDGRRPAALYIATQHAREWISAEVNRRLLRYFLERAGTDRRVTRLLRTTELWFVPVANPDGYDWTFTEGQRLWRKNLRDNDGDDQTTTADGVDLNRNFPTNWGYDNEGSSPEPSSQTYRGTGPASEPETRAMDRLMGRIDFSFLVNYHSAAELLLYGVGWQVDTPTPDDAINVALAGTDANPAIDGYDPDLSAELYITNGDTTDHGHTAHDIVSFTPELATCQTATIYLSDDEFGEDYCTTEGRSDFEFPDSDDLVQLEFEKNLDFALAVAASADDPADPVSPVGTPAPDFRVDTFDTSYGSPQEVAVWTRRAFRDVRMHHSVNGGRARSRPVREWPGGERYGDDYDVWYAEYRASIRQIGEGDRVEVWFSAKDPDRRRGSRTVESERFTFTVEGDGDADVLIVADNSPGTPNGGSAPLAHLDFYTDALDANGYTWDVHDVGVEGPAPHPLGVLGHFDAVIWYEGDKLITDYRGGLDTTLLAHQVDMAMRDYLNEGGKILATGKNHGFEEFFPLQYGDNADPSITCTDPSGVTCLLLSNDVYQYYFGGYTRIRRGGLDSGQQALDVAGTDTPYSGDDWGLDGGTSADNQGAPGAASTGTASWVTTSSVLPADEFPQFESWRSAAWVNESGSPFEPRTGEWQMATDHDDVAYKRLGRTMDLTGATSATLDFYTSYRTETDWDYVFVEAHTVGQDDWTTLPDANGHTAQGTGQSCPSGWGQQLHPQLAHYQTVTGDTTCQPTGTTGEWHAATGGSDGVEAWSIDLSRFAGRQVEVAITYATDWGTGDLGVFLDDATLTVDGAVVSETSFEEDLSGWEILGAPEGSAQNPGDWERVGLLYEIGAAVTTEDTILHGFGFEGIETIEQRDEVMRRSLEHLIGAPSPSVGGGPQVVDGPAPQVVQRPAGRRFRSHAVAGSR